MNRLTISLSIAALALAGCGAPSLHTVNEAKRSLPGQDASVLASCIGEPQSVEPVEGGEIWRFSSAQTRGADGLTLTDPPPLAAADHRACVFDFKVADGRIHAVTSKNRAGWGFGSITHCARLVETCVAG